MEIHYTHFDQDITRSLACAKLGKTYELCEFGEYGPGETL